MKTKALRVRRHGIWLLGEWYRDPDGKIMGYQTKTVLVRYDPRDISEVHVLSEKGEFICSAKRIHRTGWNDEQSYIELKKTQKARRKAIKDQRTAEERIAKIEFGYEHREIRESAHKTGKVVRVLQTRLDRPAQEIKEHHRGEEEEKPQRPLFGLSLEKMSRQRKEQEAQTEAADQDFRATFMRVAMRKQESAE